MRTWLLCVTGKWLGPRPLLYTQTDLNKCLSLNTGAVQLSPHACITNTLSAPLHRPSLVVPKGGEGRFFWMNVWTESLPPAFLWDTPVIISALVTLWRSFPRLQRIIKLFELFLRDGVGSTLLLCLSHWLLWGLFSWLCLFWHKALLSLKPTSGLVFILAHFLVHSSV